MIEAQATIQYWVDTCSFTELRRSYPRPMFAPVWEFISGLLTSQRILSIEDVYIELEQQDDDIFQWLKTWRENFIPLDPVIQNRARGILRLYPKILDIRRSKSSADPFLIAAASIRGGIIVTEEKNSGGPPKLKIPDVATRMKIPCLKLLQLLESEGFHL